MNTTNTTNTTSNNSGTRHSMVGNRPRNNSNGKRRNESSSTSSNNGFRNRGTRQGGSNGGGKGKQVSSIHNVDLLVKKAIPLNESKYESKRTIEEMPISKSLKAVLTKKGYTHPTEIQDKTLETIISGRDILGIAKTGTGKTGAFLIPIIHQLVTTGKFFQTLVLVPTRELALQVDEEFKTFTLGLNLKSSVFIGGTSVRADFQALRKQNHVIIGTTGRLLDLAKRNMLDLKRFSVLILDEFDRMLDMGFAPDVKRITELMVNRKQTLLFSATVNKAQKPLIDNLLKSPVEVMVSTGGATSDHIDQSIIRVGANEDKFNVLSKLISDKTFEKVLIFAETKRRVSQLTEKLQKSGVKTDEIHGNKAQNYRQRALDKFKNGSIRVLVATDVAARGLDISDVTHVINYQLPMSFDSYIHRIGRTGRAGKGGKAFTFVN